MKNKTDEELMRLYQKKAEEMAFLELYQRYAGRIYAFLQKRIGGRADTDAIFQETFMKLHASKNKYSSQFPFSAWIFTICRNTLIDCLRRDKRYLKLKENLKEEKEMVEDKPESSDKLQEALGHLPAIQKEALSMRFLEELPYEAISKRLSKSEANVRQMVHRGLARLKTMMVKGT